MNKKQTFIGKIQWMKMFKKLSGSDYIIKAAFDGVKSFAISAGAEATTALVEAAMQGLF